MFKSVTVLLVLIIAVSYACVCLFYPWRELAVLEMPAWVVRLVARIPEYVYGPEHDPVVILGSSLIIAPPDKAVYEVHDAAETSWENSIARRAVRYSDEISALAGRKVGLAILASPAAMVSDQCCILREMANSNKMPRLLVFTIAPRDFMDNQVGDGIDKTWIQTIFPLRSRKTLLPAGISLEALSNCYKWHAAYIDVVKRHFVSGFKSKLIKPFDQLVGRTQTSAAADTVKAEIKQDPSKAAGKPVAAVALSPEETLKKQKEYIQKVLSDYRIRYNPPNRKRFLLQAKYFEEMLELAKAADAKVLIVEMPLPRENLALVKPAQQAEFQKTVQSLATRYGAEVYDFNHGPLSVSFEETDFDDGAHLSVSGGKKFIPLFARTVAQSGAFKKSFAN